MRAPGVVQLVEQAGPDDREPAIVIASATGRTYVKNAKGCLSRFASSPIGFRPDAWFILSKAVVIGFEKHMNALHTQYVSMPKR